MDEYLPGHSDHSLPALPAIDEVAGAGATLIAPWWHTVAVLFALGMFAAVSRPRVHSYEVASHPAMYATQMLTSWMLFGAVVAGIYRRDTFFASTLRHRARRWRTEAVRGLALYFGFMVAIVTVAAVGVSGLMLYRTMHTAVRSSQSVNTSTSSGPSEPSTSASGKTSAEDLSKPPDLSRFGFRPKVVAAIAPRTLLELALWLLLSLTAGFAEEHIFRGYFLQQGLALFASKGLPMWLIRVLAVVASSLVFGSLHLYEGIGGALVVTVLGATYAVFALVFGNLRAVVVAHFLQDFVAGTVLFLIRGHGLG